MTGIDKHDGWFGGTVCRHDDESLGNACHHKHGRLYPGTQCAGWVLFEVPKDMDAGTAIATASTHEYGGGSLFIGRWSLWTEK